MTAQAQLLEELAGSRASAARPTGDHRHLHVLDDGEVEGQIGERMLQQVADHLPAVAVAFAVVHPCEVVPRHAGRACAGRLHAGQQVHQCGLATSAPARDRDHLSGLHSEVEALQGHHLEVGGLVDMDQALALDQWLRHARSLS